MATDRQLELALRVKADVKRARAELHGLEQEIKQVGTASEQAAAGGKSQTAAINAQGSAARKTTQTLNQQAASERKRFADLVHGSKSVEESERSLAERRTEAAGAARTLTKAQRDASVARARAAALDRASVKAQIADYAVLDKILSGNVKSREEVAAAEVVLDRLQKQGAIATTELTAAFAALNKVTDKNTAANVANAASRRGLNSRAYAEIGTAASEVAAGNFGRLRRTGAAFLNQSGVFRKLFTPAGLAVTGLAAGVATLALAYKHATDEVTDINRALIRSGNVTGTTAGQIENLADGLDHVSHANAVQTLTQLAASGRVSENQFHKVGQAAVDLATLTDQSVKDATDQIIEMLKSPTKGAKAFDDATHSLTAAQLQEITTLENTGHRAEAASRLLDAVAKSTKDGADEIRRSLPWYDKLFHNIGQNSSNFFSQAGNFLAGRNRYGFSAQDLKNPISRQASLKAQAKQQLAGLKTAIANYKQAVANGSNVASGAYAGDVKRYREDLKRTYAQLSELENSSTFLNAKRAAAAKKYAHEVDQAGKDAESTLQALGINTTKMMSYAQKLQTARQAIIDQFDAGLKLPPGVKLNTATYEPYGPGWDKIKKQLRGPQGHSGERAAEAARKKAEALTKSAAEANQQLRDTFIQLQAAQDPTAAAWARYNDVVGKANQRVTDATSKLDALVAAGKLSRAEADRRIASNKALASGIEYMARQTRQAAIDKLADADRRAWEKLKDSLRTPAEVATDEAIRKLKELKKLLDAGDSGITQAQYNVASRKIGQQSVTQAPQYQGLSPQVGGIGSDLARNFEAQKALDTWHQTQLEQTQKFHEQGELNEQAYQARLAEIDRQYASQRTKIEADRGRLVLQTSANLFGQLATLQSSHNSKMARIGKAAAIAQAIITTYQSANEAYAAMASIPYVGPALGAAAAAVAIAAGLANVAQIRSQPVGGYSEGGYTGPGAKHQPAGIVHAGEVVWSQDDIKRAGGVGIVETMRLRGYAQGGYVSPLANAPSPAELGISAPSMPRMRIADFAASGGASGNQDGDPQTHIHVWSIEEAQKKLFELPATQKGVIHIVGDNPRTIQGRWSAG